MRATDVIAIWRKTKAYASMNATQQGLLRNIFDEIIVGPDGYIQGDALPRASGDSAAWAVEGRVVLGAMLHTENGWTIPEALDVRDSERKAASMQAAKARARWDGRRAAAPAAPRPAPRPVPAPAVGAGQLVMQPGGQALAPRKAVSWSTRLCIVWQEEKGGNAPGSMIAGQVGRMRQRLLKAGQWTEADLDEALEKRLRVFLKAHTGAQARFVSVSKFCETFNDWTDDGDFGDKLLREGQAARARGE